MSTDVVILQCLSGACEEELQLFERATVVFGARDPKSCYVCIGRHGVFFVEKEMGQPVAGCGKLPYLQIGRAVTDASSRRLFLLELGAENGGQAADSDWDGGDRLLVESQCREALLERIALCWQAECMFRTYQVRKFPQARATIGAQLAGSRAASKNGIDLLQVLPFKGYQDGFSHRGYSFFLRQGFKSASGLKNGTYLHEDGWEVSYNSLALAVPPGVEVTIHVGEPQTALEVEQGHAGQDDLKTVAASYKEALVEHLDQFYILANSAYMKRMNRGSDIASWHGWEFLIRAKDNVFACVLLRREYIPPLCDIVQDVAVLLRCPAQQGLDQTGCEAVLDECRFVADSLAPVAEVKQPYREIIQARLDTLQCTDEAYRWLEGQLGLTPVHKNPAGIKFVKSIVTILEREGQIMDETILDAEVFRDIPVLNDPLLVPQEMLSDAEQLLGSQHDKKGRDERRNAWYCRISRYLAYCVDGGIMGERFTIATLVQAMGRRAGETDKVLRNIVEFLLHVMPHGDFSHPWSSGRASLAQLLQEPEEFGKYALNRHVLRVLLTENYLASEWRRRHRSSGASYEKLLAALLTSETVGISLRTLICRQILENTNSKDPNDDNERQAQTLVPALVKVMHGRSGSLASCATAALVNLSCGRESTKNLLVSQGVLKLCMKQLKSKDDDLTLYTLYLLVNLTKTAHHRAIVVREGGVPLLVDILTSSYQNTRKHKILTEIASVVGQLCNDAETRVMLSDDFPVVLCLLYVGDQAQPNTKLKAKLLFALRQLAGSGSSRLKVGQHVIPDTIEQIAQAKPKFLDCLVNAVLLLTLLAGMRTHALQMSHQDRLNRALEQCGLQHQGQEAKGHRFGPSVWDKVVALKDRIRESELGS